MYHFYAKKNTVQSTDIFCLICISYNKLRSIAKKLLKIVRVLSKEIVGGAKKEEEFGVQN